MKQYRIKDYKEAKVFVDDYMKNKRDYAVIHYACQGFYSTTNQTYPRIVAICILFPQSMQKQLFSLTSLAEMQNIDLHTADEIILDRLEKEMLKDFYDFVKKQKRDYKWLHWNMRDHFFGFAAIAQRYCKLHQKKKAPFEFANDKQQNIAILLKQRYGENYAERPHQQNILRLNHMTPKNLLSGKEEADAYDRREFLAMERSLEDKVAAFAEILDRMGNNELKTKGRILRDVYGLNISGILIYLKENAVFGLFSTVVGGLIINALYDLAKKIFA